MKCISFFLTMSAVILPQVSHAAFLTCEDAASYGRNVSALFTELVYEKTDCNIELLATNEEMLAAMGATPLPTEDSDEKKVCYFSGYYGGLTERLPYEYGECLAAGGPPEYFGCIPAETIAMYAAKVLIGAVLSVDMLTAEAAHSIFTSAPEYDICEEAEPGSCRQEVVDVLSAEPLFDDEVLRDLLVQRFCPEEGDGDDADG